MPVYNQNKGLAEAQVGDATPKNDMTAPMETVADQILCGDSTEVLRTLPDESVHLIVTSPPYWNLVDYGIPGQIGQSSYERYLRDLLGVWRECARVLIPNGKLCINTPIVPIPKKQMNSTHTRHLKNINNDIEASILNDEQCALQRYSLYVWQKQTSVKMFGSYPHPPNIYEDNTIEFINVLVKPGKPRKLSKPIKEGSRLSQEMWLNLTMQVWPLYPQDVARAGSHPAPFPVVLPQRLILMYTFAAVPEHDFPGDIVLDPFNGTGATCLAAKSTGRRYVGIDLNPDYCAFARHRVEPRRFPPVDVKLRRVKMRSVKGISTQPALFGDLWPGKTGTICC
ncbi:MAG: site-specific DNA-methyltransferase [Planctomycetota bacterium]